METATTAPQQISLIFQSLLDVSFMGVYGVHLYWHFHEARNNSLECVSALRQM